MDETQFKDEMNKSFEGMKKIIDESFIKLGKSPSEEEKIIELWRAHVSDFISYTFKASEKNNNKDIFKAITKALAFGK